MGLWGQNSAVSIRNVSSLAQNERWDLNKYVWSHKHSQPSKSTKPLLDFNALDNWESLVEAGTCLSISRNGQYFAYGIQTNRYRQIDTLVVQSTSSSWRQVFPGATPGFFSSDSRQYVFQDKENLCFLQTGDSRRSYIKAVASYKLPTTGRNEWLACQLKNIEATLLLQNLLTGKEKRFPGVSVYSFDRTGKWLVCQLNNKSRELLIYNLTTESEKRFQFAADYLFDKSGETLLLKTIEKKEDATHTAVQYINLSEGTINTIWSTNDSTVINSYGFDDSGRQVVFIVQKASFSSSDGNTIWYWRVGMNQAVMKADNQTAGIKPDMLIQATAAFTDNGRYIQFALQTQPDPRHPDPDAVKLDLWSYKDTVIQSTQSWVLKQPISYVAVLNLESDLIIQLENEYETLKTQINGHFAVTSKSLSGDRFWEKDYRRDSNWLISLRDGSRRLLPVKGWKWDLNVVFSPGGRYLLLFDTEGGRNYFSYDLHTGKLSAISASVPAWQFAYRDLYEPVSKKGRIAVGVAGWLQGDSGVLVYDNFDIWQLDLTGKNQPINITNGYGRLHSTKLELSGWGEIRVYAEKDILFLKAFNRQSKYNGYYQKLLGSVGNPEILYMGPCFIEDLSWINAIEDGMQPLKAAEANVWIVKRQTTTEAPNYFVTEDFKTYKSLTNLCPHKSYNWLTAELHSFKQLDGTLSQGILYKPENFDSTKKYPVIIAFYKDLSDHLFQYPTPGLINTPNIMNNPAWMVSHGYLVFLPDIYFINKKWGPSVLNTVDGAARYLSTLSFVDGKRMGAAGHSNSGRLGAYVLTHSKSFAAMSIGEGYSFANVINAALSLYSDEISASTLELGEINALGGELGSIWENKSTWWDHTMVLQADRVKSPLLMFCKFKDVKTKGSGDNKIEQAIQMFTALRRLEKKVWWLGYNEATHTIGKPQDQKDFTIRYTQFFDHYLKGAPAPRWMTEGIPAKLKGIESKYELHPDGKCGKDCPVCDSVGKKTLRKMSN